MKHCTAFVYSGWVGYLSVERAQLGTGLNKTHVICVWQHGSKAKAFLKPVILEEILTRHKQKVANVVTKESAGPIEHCKVYDKYNFLITKQVRTNRSYLLSYNVSDVRYEVLHRYWGRGHVFWCAVQTLLAAGNWRNIEKGSTLFRFMY